MQPGRRHAAGADHLDRDRLVLAAADLVDREGWSGLNLSRVAREVDRHVTSLYSHVDGLEGLRREVTLLALDEMGRELWQAALGRSGVDAIVAIAEAYRRYAAAHPGRLEAMATYQMRGEDAEIQERNVHMAQPVFATLRSLGLDDHQVVHAHRVFFASLRGFAITEAAGLYQLPESIDETFSQLVLLFVRALAGGTWPQLQAPAAATAGLPNSLQMGSFSDPYCNEFGVEEPRAGAGPWPSRRPVEPNTAG